MEKIRGVNFSEIRLLFDPSPPIYLFFYFAEASVIFWDVKGLFSILLHFHSHARVSQNVL